VISLWCYTFGSWCLVVIGVQIFVHSWLEFLVHCESVFTCLIRRFACVHLHVIDIAISVQMWLCGQLHVQDDPGKLLLSVRNWIGRWMGSRAPVTKSLYTYLTWTMAKQVEITRREAGVQLKRSVFKIWVGKPYRKGHHVYRRHPVVLHKLNNKDYFSQQTMSYYKNNIFLYKMLQVPALMGHHQVRINKKSRQSLLTETQMGE
jgi:hypothetical protein